MCIHIRDTLFDGSWNKMLKFIKEKGSIQQRTDIPRIKKLMTYEKKYGVNLNQMGDGEAGSAKKLKPIDQKKKKLSEDLLKKCELSGLSPRHTKNVLEVLLYFIDKQIKAK